MIRVLTSAALLLSLGVLATATPLWLRPERTLVSYRAQEPYAPEDYWLPTWLSPESYKIALIPYLDDNVPAGKEAFTFDGVVTITLTVTNLTDVIRIHAFDIVIDSLADITVATVETEPVPVEVLDYTTPSLATPENKDDKHFLEITLSEQLAHGKKYDLTIKYKGFLNNQLEGFYRSSYQEDGVTKYMAVTQFESTGARRAFPCFDEPGIKATFEIKIARKSEEYTVLGNMPIIREDEPVEDPGLSGWKYVQFAPTKPQSSYLVAFSVNKFSATNEINEDEIIYKVWARPKVVSDGVTANLVAPQVVAEMTSFTAVKYPLPKIDQIAVPDFAAGAMENWGLITYREGSLLYNEQFSTTSNLQRVGSIVTHELAHQWFGNLVSPKWWGNLWLNEGFATYFEYFALNKIYPEMKMDEQFIVDAVQPAMDADALETTHPIVATVDSPTSIDTIFDDISYEKGGCIVRFMITLMGEENFKTGIHKYLEDNQYGNAAAEDLFAALTTAVPENVLPNFVSFPVLMDSWTRQSGYPVIHVERLYDEKKRAVVSQKRFLSLPSETNFTEQWIVPLTMTNGADSQFDNFTTDAWLLSSNIVLDNVAGNDDWVIFNVQQKGFYRVNYDESNWQMLAKAIDGEGNLNKIHLLNRAQLINDALALARAKELSYPIALDTTNYLSYETEYVPWATAFRSLQYISDRFISEENARGFFQEYLLSKVLNIYKQLGGFTIPEDEPHITSLTRSLVLKWACNMGYTECKEEASKLFKEWQAAENGENPIAPNLRSVVYCSGVGAGGQAEWDFLFEKFLAAFETPSEQAMIISSLGCASKTEILQGYLNMALNTSIIRSQDVRSAITAVYNNPLGVDIALDFILTNYKEISDVMGGFSSVGRLFTGIAIKLNTPEQKIKLQEFYDSNEETLAGAADDVRGAILRVDENLKWHEDHKATVVSYFASKSSAAVIILSPLVILVSVISKFVH